MILGSDHRTRIAAAGYYAQLAQGHTLIEAHKVMEEQLMSLWPENGEEIAKICLLAFTPCEGTA